MNQESASPLCCWRSPPAGPGPRRRTLYVTGEESAAQVRLRAGRTNALADELYLAAETDLGTVLGHIEEVAPSLLVVDSVQTIGTAETDGSPGGVSQVREVTGALVRVAKRRGMAVMIVGHVTKDGAIAGPRLLEHLVDVVLAFDGDRHSGFRMVRATKNRFGPADEVGCFELVEQGILEVPDPSGLFTSQHATPVPGHLYRRDDGGPATAACRAPGPCRADTAAESAPHGARPGLEPGGDGAGRAPATGPAEPGAEGRVRVHGRRRAGGRPVG